MEENTNKYVELEFPDGKVPDGKVPDGKVASGFYILRENSQLNNSPGMSIKLF